jgi:hypothetical protein
MPTSKVSRGPACVLAANGQVAAAAPPRNVMNSRRRMCPPYRPPPVQWLKSSTLRPDGDQEMVHNRPETLIRPDVLWMAPALQEAIDAMARVGCSLLFGLLMQSVETAGPDGVREQVPILLIRL